MFDDLRDTGSPLYEDESEKKSSKEFYNPDDVEAYIDEAEDGEGMFMGMTASQRFVISLILFLMICLLGAFCLVITEKVVPPLF